VIKLTYADITAVLNLTKEVKTGMHNDEAYDALQAKAIDYADKKINNKLKKNSVQIPTTTEIEDLKSKLTSEDESIKKEAEKDPLTSIFEAGNLYAAAFIFTTYYSSSDTISPTSKSYQTDADEFVDGYIDEYLQDNQESHAGIQIGIFTINGYTGRDP